MKHKTWAATENRRTPLHLPNQFELHKHEGIHRHDNWNKSFTRALQISLLLHCLAHWLVAKFHHMPAISQICKQLEWLSSPSRGKGSSTVDHTSEIDFTPVNQPAQDRLDPYSPFFAGDLPHCRQIKQPTTNYFFWLAHYLCCFLFLL